jgi:hypothetical protein
MLQGLDGAITASDGSKPPLTNTSQDGASSNPPTPRDASLPAGIGRRIGAASSGVSSVDETAINAAVAVAFQLASNSASAEVLLEVRFILENRLATICSRDFLLQVFAEPKGSTPKPTHR